MARWRNKAIVNLLENSTEKNDHSIAAKEWAFSGEVVDHFVSNQVCQLCESENLRYHFEIKNKSRDNSGLLVGSSCIKKFDISVFDENGKEIFGSQKSSFLQKKIDQKKQELMLEQIRSLWKVANPEEKDTIEYYVYEHKNKNGFSPNDLYDLFSLMERYKTEFNKVLFKVSLRSQFELNCLINMPEHEKDIILPCLSVAQKKRFSEKNNQAKKEKESKSNAANKMFENEHPSFEIENNRHISQLPISKQPPSPPKKEYEPVHLPDYATCSICGEFKRWVCSNPYKCGECLKKIHNKQ